MKHFENAWTVFRIIIFLISRPRWTINMAQKVWEYHRLGDGSFMDTDWYKFTMAQFIWKYFRGVWVELSLTVRSKDVEYPAGFAAALIERLKFVAENHHSLTAEQAAWMKKIGYINDDFVDFLADTSQPKLRFSALKIKELPNNQLDIKIADEWLFATWWEIVIMKEKSALLYKMQGKKLRGFDWLSRAARKARRLKKAGASTAEMGARRRFSFWSQFWVLVTMMAVGGLKDPNKPGGITGTSNVFIAWALNINLIGTMAHELFVIIGSLFGWDKANPIIIKLWQKEYGHELGYYLPDTYTSAKFFSTFTADAAAHFTGPRQDSGNPFNFIKLAVEAYRRLGFTPKRIKQKTIIFSDSLDVDKIIEILAAAKAAGIGAAFGVGTHFSNDVGYKALNMVVKPYRVWLADRPEDDRGCVKISDDSGKYTGEETAIKQALYWLENGEIQPKPLLVFDFNTLQYREAA
jgi:nicotinate phosphoribosyltransferase